MIKSLSLKNFTVFGDLKIDFSPKVNVIIGENGTGKTHLLKAAYALCSGNNVFKNKSEIGEGEIEAALTSKVVRLFLPMDDKLGKMRRQGAGREEWAQLEMRFALDKKVVISFHTKSNSITIQESANYEQYGYEPVFIPTKEVLSFMKGFNSLYEKYGLSFDQTYQDVCLLLDLPEIRSELLQEKAKWAMEEIEDICGGRFIFYGGGKVTFKTESAEYSANCIAEGFRKAGMLSRLLETGAIQPGVSGPLFWDEPEANMNPKLMRLFVQIILELSRNGQQIILATHDYVLLKWLDQLPDKGKEDSVLFHSLYHDSVNGEIMIKSSDDYRQLKNNAISDSLAELYDEDVKRALGEG